MKKFVVGLVLLLAVVAGGLYYLYSNLEYFAKQQIETAGSAAAGTAVTVDEVVIDLPAGHATIRGFRVANPEGYSANSMLSFTELDVVLDLDDLSRDRIGITSIFARNPHVLYEMQGNVSNLDVIRARLTAPAPAAETSTTVRNDLYLDIARVDIEDIDATLSSTLLATPVEVSLGDIELRNLSGTPEEIANQIMEPMIVQLSTTAARALLGARASDIRDEVLEQVDAGLEAAGETLRKTGANLREGLNDLFNGDDNDTAEQPATQP